MANDLDRARELRCGGEQDGLAREQIINLIQQRCEVSPLRAYRLYAGESAEALADELGVTRTQVQKWETGTHRPEYGALDRLCRIYRTNPMRLGLFTDYTAQETNREDVPSTPPGVTVEIGPDAAFEEDTTDRRSLLASLGAVPLVEGLEHLRQRTDRLFSETTVSPGRIDTWEEAADAYWGEILSKPPATVLADLGRDYREITWHLDRPQPAETSRDLSRVAALYASLIASAFSRLGQRHYARHWHVTAQEAADQSGDNGVRAWIMERQLVRSFNSGDLDRAARLSVQVRHIAPKKSAPLVGALAMQAQVLALQDRGDAARAFIRERVEPAFAALPAERTREEGRQSWPEYRLHFTRSFVHAVNGDARAARDAQATALALYPPPPAHYANRTQVSLHHAALLVREGDPVEGARQAVATIQELPRNYRIDQVMSTAKMVADMVPAKARNHRAVNELNELLAVEARKTAQRKEIT